MSKRSKPKSPVVDVREVERLANLSRLSLTGQEAERLRGELSSILGYFATLDKVQVPKDSPAQGTSRGGGQRRDAVRPSNSEEILAGVPQKKGRYVKAPKVF